MTESDGYFECICGRTFAQAFAFRNHQRKCATSKRKLNDALGAARHVWEAKRQRREAALEAALEAAASTAAHNVVKEVLLHYK